MAAFVPRSLELCGRLEVAGVPDRVFPLFSPDGERAWVPGWDPELLHPPGVRWGRGQIFRTREEKGEAIWLVSALDLTTHRVEYHRVEPGRWVARVEVTCRAQEGATEVTVAYTFVGLSEAGNTEIAAMSRAGYKAKMARWKGWLDGLQAGRGSA